jgi:DNA-binding transcriptional regulator GbsR (MarR family)
VTDSEPSSSITPAERIVSDAIGRLIEFWGFKRNMGRAWAVLYLSAEPLSARTLRSRLVLSAGAASMTLNELQRWGVVKRVFVEGNRQEHFVAEINVWKMVSRVFRERELVEIVEAIGSFEEALATLPKQGATPSDTLRRDRITSLLEVARLGRAVVEALVSAGQVDASELAKQLFLGRGDGGSR